MYTSMKNLVREGKRSYEHSRWEGLPVTFVDNKVNKNTFVYILRNQDQPFKYRNAQAEMNVASSLLIIDIIYVANS